MNLLSVGYVLSRVVYTLVYINNTTVGMARVRTLVYLVGIGQIVALYVMSGMALARS